MLPMRFDREIIGPPTRFQELMASMAASRRTRYVLGGVVAVFVVSLYFLTTRPIASPEHAASTWQPAEETTFETPVAEPPVRFQRQERVKNAFIRAYSTYEKHAYPHDELLPLSNGNQDK